MKKTKKTSPKKNSPKKTKKKYAYVWLLMLGSVYLPGILVSAYSIKRLGTPHDLVCMVTKDVPQKTRKELLKVLDKVIEVPYLNFKIRKFRKWKDRYSKFLHLLFTKWNCLNLTYYDKIFFLDADVIITRSLNHVFKISTKKGPIGSFVHVFGKKNTFD